MKGVGTLTLNQGNLTVQGAEVLRTIEVGVQGGSDEWKDLMQHDDSKAIVIMVDMDKTVPGVEEEVESDREGPEGEMEAQ